MGNFQRDGNMAFYNQGARPNYLSSIQPISFKERTVDLDKLHGKFTGEAITFLSEIRPEDFNAPRKLWEKVFDDGAKERFIKNISGHMETVTDKEIIKRQIAIFREVSEDIASRMEKATGVQGYPGISGLRFNGTHNGMAKSKENKVANGMTGISAKYAEKNKTNGAPKAGTHKEIIEGQ
jgi:catalase